MFRPRRYLCVANACLPSTSGLGGAQTAPPAPRRMVPRCLRCQRAGASSQSRATPPSSLSSSASERGKTQVRGAAPQPKRRRGSPPPPSLVPSSPPPPPLSSPPSQGRRERRGERGRGEAKETLLPLRPAKRTSPLRHLFVSRDIRVIGRHHIAASRKANPPPPSSPLPSPPQEQQRQHDQGSPRFSLDGDWNNDGSHHHVALCVGGTATATGRNRSAQAAVERKEGEKETAEEEEVASVPVLSHYVRSAKMGKTTKAANAVARAIRNKSKPSGERSGGRTAREEKQLDGKEKISPPVLSQQQLQQQKERIIIEDEETVEMLLRAQFPPVPLLYRAPHTQSSLKTAANFASSVSDSKSSSSSSSVRSAAGGAGQVGDSSLPADDCLHSTTSELGGGGGGGDGISASDGDFTIAKHETEQKEADVTKVTQWDYDAALAFPELCARETTAAPHLNAAARTPFPAGGPLHSAVALAAQLATPLVTEGVPAYDYPMFSALPATSYFSSSLSRHRASALPTATLVSAPGASLFHRLHGFPAGPQQHSFQTLEKETVSGASAVAAASSIESGNHNSSNNNNNGNTDARYESDSLREMCGRLQLKEPSFMVIEESEVGAALPTPCGLQSGSTPTHSSHRRHRQPADPSPPSLLEQLPHAHVTVECHRQSIPLFDAVAMFLSGGSDASAVDCGGAYHANTQEPHHAAAQGLLPSPEMGIHYGHVGSTGVSHFGRVPLNDPSRSFVELQRLLYAAAQERGRQRHLYAATEEEEEAEAVNAGDEALKNAPTISDGSIFWNGFFWEPEKDPAVSRAQLSFFHRCLEHAQRQREAFCVASLPSGFSSGTAVEGSATSPPPPPPPQLAAIFSPSFSADGEDDGMVESTATQRQNTGSITGANSGEGGSDAVTLLASPVSAATEVEMVSAWVPIHWQSGENNFSEAPQLELSPDSPARARRWAVVTGERSTSSTSSNNRNSNNNNSSCSGADTDGEDDKESNDTADTTMSLGERNNQPMRSRKQTQNQQQRQTRALALRHFSDSFILPHTLFARQSTHLLFYRRWRVVSLRDLMVLDRAALLEARMRRRTDAALRTQEKKEAAALKERKEAVVAAVTAAAAEGTERTQGAEHGDSVSSAAAAITDATGGDKSQCDKQQLDEIHAQMDVRAARRMARIKWRAQLRLERKSFMLTSAVEARRRSLLLPDSSTGSTNSSFPDTIAHVSAGDPREEPQSTRAPDTGAAGGGTVLWAEGRTRPAWERFLEQRARALTRLPPYSAASGLPLVRRARLLADDRRVVWEELRRLNAAADAPTGGGEGNEIRSGGGGGDKTGGAGAVAIAPLPSRTTNVAVNGSTKEESDRVPPQQEQLAELEWWRRRRRARESVVRRRSLLSGMHKGRVCWLSLAHVLRNNRRCSEAARTREEEGAGHSAAAGSSSDSTMRMVPKRVVKLVDEFMHDTSPPPPPPGARDHSGVPFDALSTNSKDLATTEGEGELRRATDEAANLGGGGGGGADDNRDSEEVQALVRISHAVKREEHLSGFFLSDVPSWFAADAAAGGNGAAPSASPLEWLLDSAPDVREAFRDFSRISDCLAASSFLPSHSSSLSSQVRTDSSHGVFFFVLSLHPEGILGLDRSPQSSSSNAGDDTDEGEVEAALRRSLFCWKIYRVGTSNSPHADQQEEASHPVAGANASSHENNAGDKMGGDDGTMDEVVINFMFSFSRVTAENTHEENMRELRRVLLKDDRNVSNNNNGNSEAVGELLRGRRELGDYFFIDVRAALVAVEYAKRQADTQQQQGEQQEQQQRQEHWSKQQISVSAPHSFPQSASAAGCHLFPSSSQRIASHYRDQMASAWTVSFDEYNAFYKLISASDPLRHLEDDDGSGNANVDEEREESDDGEKAAAANQPETGTDDDVEGTDQGSGEAAEMEGRGLHEEEEAEGPNGEASEKEEEEEDEEGEADAGAPSDLSASSPAAVVERFLRDLDIRSVSADGTTRAVALSEYMRSARRRLGLPAPRAAATAAVGSGGGGALSGADDADALDSAVGDFPYLATRALRLSTRVRRRTKWGRMQEQRVRVPGASSMGDACAHPAALAAAAAARRRRLRAAQARVSRETFAGAREEEANEEAETDGNAKGGGDGGSAGSSNNDGARVRRADGANDSECGATEDEVSVGRRDDTLALDLVRIDAEKNEERRNLFAINAARERAMIRVGSLFGAAGGGGGRRGGSDGEHSSATTIHSSGIGSSKREAGGDDDTDATQREKNDVATAAALSVEGLMKAEVDRHYHRWLLWAPYMTPAIHHHLMQLTTISAGEDTTANSNNAKKTNSSSSSHSSHSSSGSGGVSFLLDACVTARTEQEDETEEEGEKEENDGGSALRIDDLGIHTITVYSAERVLNSTHLSLQL